jgi:hypothetical protein
MGIFEEHEFSAMKCIPSYCFRSLISMKAFLKFAIHSIVTFRSSGGRTWLAQRATTPPSWSMNHFQIPTQELLQKGWLILHYASCRKLFMSWLDIGCWEAFSVELEKPQFEEANGPAVGICDEAGKSFQVYNKGASQGRKQDIAELCRRAISLRNKICMSP